MYVNQYQARIQYLSSKYLNYNFPELRSMNDLFSPLSEDEFEFLDNFLLNRVDEDAYIEGMDEGVLDMSELDGLFTAIVSGPVMIPPSQWVQVVWGDFEPVWESEEEFGVVFSLMMRYMNGIVSALMNSPEEFEPMFHEREVEGKTYKIVDECCEGYLHGVGMATIQWDSGGMEMKVLLTPIVAFTSASKWSGHDLTEGEVENVQKAITPNVRDIHAYWLARREKFIPDTRTVRHSEPRVGRNDPCPCGSGKKFKKCCLH
jgi:uncharacterized protein